MMKKHILITLLSLFAYTISYSQAVEPSSGVDSKIFQIELEGQFAQEKDGNHKISTLLLPATLFRYGLSNRIELQLNSQNSRERLSESGETAYISQQFYISQIGASINLWTQDKWIPEAALMIRANLPASILSWKNIGETIALNLSNSFNEKWSLNYNIGYNHDIGQKRIGYYILNLSYVPNNTWHFYIENQGVFNQRINGIEIINGGFGINFTNNFIADFSFGKGINKDFYYTGLIVTWAINTAKT